MKAIVIGAGIGGLSAAVALEKAGIDCTVFEAVKRSNRWRGHLHLAQRGEMHAAPRHGRHH